MTDAARTPRRRLEQGTPALPIQVAGIDGIGPLNPTSLPVAPTTSIPDRSQDFLARADQSVQNAFDIQQQTIDSNLRANMAEAEARGRSRNGFGQSLAGALEAASAIFMNVRDRQQLSNAAQFENETREFLFRFHSDIAEQGLTEGVIATHTAMQRELRKRYQGQVAPDVLQSISNIGWNALTGVQAELGQRKINEMNDARSFVVDQRLSQASILAAAEISRISQVDPGLFGDQVRFNDVINGIVTRQLDSLTGVSGTDRLKAEAFLRTQVLSSLQEQGFSIDQQRARSDNLSAIIQQADAIQTQFANDPLRYKQAMSLLQVRSDELGLDVVLSDIFVSPESASGLIREHRENISAINSSLRANVPSALAQSAEYTTAKSVEVMAGAVTYFNNPVLANQYIAEVESQDDPDPTDVAVIRQIRELQQASETVRNNDVRYRQILAQQADLEVEAQRAIDQLDPQNRIDVNLSDDAAVQQLTQLLQLGVQQARISPETANAINAKLQQDNRTLNTEARQLLQQSNTILGYYQDEFGYDLRNPLQTDRLLQRREQVQPVLNEARNSPGRRIQNSDFQWGLP